MVTEFKHRAIIDTIPSYVQGKPAPQISGLTPYKLSSNENPYPPLPGVQKVLEEGPLQHFNRYPDMRGTAICQRIADLYKVKLENVVLGAGSTEIITQLINIVAGPGDEIVYPWRSFEAYPIIVANAGAVSVQVPLTADCRHDIDAMIAALTDRTRLVIVNNPNNPTATSVSRQEVEKLMAVVPPDVLVLMDEAYFQFNQDPDRSIARQVWDRYPNMVIAQTFSKAYGLAGLRIGYGIARPEIADAMMKAALPFAVSDLAQTAALTSLDLEDELMDRVKLIVSERDRLMNALREQGWTTIPQSQANYFWLPLGPKTDQAYERFRQQALAVRAFSGDGIRVSVGLPEANDRVLALCQELYNDGFEA